MNDRIKNLMYEVGVPTTIPFDQWCEKFAESIIKDVIKSVDSYDFKIDPDDLICELKQRYLQR